MGMTFLPAPLDSSLALQVSTEALNFSWVRGVAVMASWLLLPFLPLIALLVTRRAHRARGAHLFPALRTRLARTLAGTLCLAVVAALSIAVMYYNGLLSWPGWLGASLVFFVPCAMSGAALAVAFMPVRQGRGRTAPLLPIGATGGAILLALLAFYGPLGGPAGITSNYYYGWGLCALPAFVGGILLARSVAARRTGRASYTWYIAMCLLFAGTIGLGAYMNLMEGVTYAFVAPERMFGPYASARVTDAVLASIAATLVYAGGSLLLLLLPYTLDGRSSGRRQGEIKAVSDFRKQTAP